MPRSRPTVPFAVAGAATPRRTTIDRLLRARAPYDLIWCFELTSAVAIGSSADRTPVVVDVDAVPYLHDEADAVSRTRRRFARRDRAAWQAWIERLGGSVAAVTFSNPLEASLFDLGNAVLVPNGCTVPRYRGARDVAARPVLSFVGWMGYEPNADAARYLVREIVPELRATLDTDFEVRLIGSVPPDIQDLAQDPNVTVTGYVDDLAAEVDRTDLIVVPVRRGAGTRIKVIEAFASQVPVVSTTFGALGIGAVDGAHLLLADGAQSFAQACRRVLTDADLRKRLVKAAYALASEHHDWAVIEVQVASIAAVAIGNRRAQPRTT